MADLSSFSDQEIIARTIWGESRGEGYRGQKAVCNVIFNRANKPCWWGTTPREVCLKPYQFSCWNSNDPNYLLLIGPINDPVYQQCMDIANMGLSNNLPDLTNGADSYEVIGLNAKWTSGLTPCAVIGHHSFYKVY